MHALQHTSGLKYYTLHISALRFLFVQHTRSQRFFEFNRRVARWTSALSRRVRRRRVLLPRQNTRQVKVMSTRERDPWIFLLVRLETRRTRIIVIHRLAPSRRSPRVVLLCPRRVPRRAADARDPRARRASVRLHQPLRLAHPPTHGLLFPILTDV